MQEKVTIERGDDEADPDADVVVASVPTLGRKDTLRLNRFNPLNFSCIVVDEAHHSVADSYMRIMEHFGIIQRMENGTIEKGPMANEILLWGCSATLRRNDYLALGDLFEEVSYQLDFSKAIEQGWLCPVQCFQLATDVDLDNVEISNGDFEMTGLSLAIDTPTRNSLIVRTWLQLAHTEHQRKSTIVFALNVKHAHNLALAFSELGIECALITGSTNENERKSIIQRFSQGDIPVLLNCAVLTEGTDLPITDCILMTRPTCNDNLYVQMVGRGLRQHPSKEYCLVLDVVDKTKRTGPRSLVNLPCLLSQKERSTSTTNTLRRERKIKEIDPSQIKIQVLKSEIENFSISSKLAWIKVNDFLYIIPTFKNVFELHIINFVEAELSSPIFTIDQGPIQEVLLIFEEKIKDWGFYKFMHKDAHWRIKNKCSDGQYKVLCNIASNFELVNPLYLNNLKKISCGQAADLITLYNYSKKYKREFCIHTAIESIIPEIKELQT